MGALCYSMYFPQKKGLVFHQAFFIEHTYNAIQLRNLFPTSSFLFLQVFADFLQEN
jgi:hypothetical protein